MNTKIQYAASRRIFILIILVGNVHLCSAQTKLIMPGISNSYVGQYILPDKTIRLIGSEHGGTRELFFVDRHPDGTITEPVFYPESFGDIEFNFAGFECQALLLKSGDAILGINQVDCDYSPYSSIARFSPLGDVLWAVSVEEFPFSFFIHRVTPVDSNIICIISDQGDTVYLDINGNLVPENQYVVFDTVLSVEHGYYAVLQNVLFRLDDGFNVLDSIALDDQILYIAPSGDSVIIASTLESMYKLDVQFEVRGLSIEFVKPNLITTTNQWIWIGKVDGDIIKLDYQLHPIDTILVHQDLILKQMVGIDDTLILTGNHQTPTGISSFFHGAHENDINFNFRQDARIDSISLSTPVYYSFEEVGAYPWGFNINYHDVSVHVSNAGFDTIQSLTVRYNPASSCSLCQGQDYRWPFDNLNLPPGESLILPVGDFYAFCTVFSPSNFCLTILPVDSVPEISSGNNLMCRGVDALLAGTNDPASISIKAFPNPADQMLNIEFDLESASTVACEIFNSVGVVVRKLISDQPDIAIPVGELPEGIYFLQIIDEHKNAALKKVIIVH